MNNIYYFKKDSVKAIRWEGDRTSVTDFLNELVGEDPRETDFGYTADKRVLINSDNGVIEVYKGDWIVRFKEGVFSVFNDEIFKELFEEIMSGSGRRV